ncbi:carbonic anhydrase [Emcibacter sp. SYSU 3D8]|uniref:carbonic anhydrase n=1 Tax=Emcibacter sp. SYSU 3D8 TaxID=3133969 RepID=UPI0031FF164A
MPQHWIRRFAQGYRSFRQNYFEKNRQLFQQLRDGQTPKVMLVSCCDSRVEPSLILDAGPGDLFIARNIANLIPPYEPDMHHHGTSAALEFAVKNLGVSHIVVMGHAECGGIAAALAGELAGESQFIGTWVSMISPIRNAVLKEAGDRPVAEQQRLLEQRSIVQSLRNLDSFPFVVERVQAGSLFIHGWWFDIHSGDLLAYDSASDAFGPLPF